MRFSSPTWTTATTASTSEGSPECCCTSRVQPLNVPQHHSTSPSTILAPRYCSHPVQDAGAGLQGGEKKCSFLPPSHEQTLHLGLTTAFFYLRTFGCPVIQRSVRSLISVKAPLCSGRTLVEWTPQWSQDIRVTAFQGTLSNTLFFQSLMTSSSRTFWVWMHLLKAALDKKRLPK